MPQGKPAGVPCVQLLPDMRCAIFGQSSRPDFCGGLQPQHDMCGADRDHAIAWLQDLERATAPSH